MVTSIDVESSMPWYRKYARHVLALLQKNAFWLLLLLWLSDKAIQADNDDLSQYKEVRNPEPELIGGIPECEGDLYHVEGSCYDFIYTPVGNPIVEDIVTSMRENNPDRAIAADRVLGFGSPEEANAWLADNVEKTQVAVHFSVDNATSIQFDIQTNGTAKYFKGDFQNAFTKYQMPMELVAHTAIMRSQFGTLGVPFEGLPTAYISEFAHPALGSISIVSTAGSMFLYAAGMFGFILFLGSVAQEREIGMKQSLKTLGMLTSAYHTSWLAWEMSLNIVTALIIMISGYIFGFQIITENNFFVSFFLFLLFQWALTAVAFFFTPFLRKSTSAIYLGFVLFLLGWIMQLVIAFGYPYVPQYEGDPLYVIFSLFPWALFTKGMRDLDDMTSQARPGISWSERSSYCDSRDESVLASGCNNNEELCECVMPLADIYWYLLAQTVVYTILALYFDLVVPDEEGNAEVPWFFVLPRYWMPSLSGRYSRKVKSDDPHAQELTSSIELHTPVAVPVTSAPSGSGGGDGSRDGATTSDGNGVVRSEDDRPSASEQGLRSVAVEEERLKALLTPVGSGRHQRFLRRVPVKRAAEDAPHEGGVAEAAAPSVAMLEVYGLQKRFGKKFWAVLGNWFDVHEGTIFCLLGPNGAGKTSSIKCLTGVQPVTGGDAIVNNLALRSPASLNALRACIGVCPQFDVLWPELTGRNHARIFSWIKGVPSKDVKKAADQSLAEVALTEAADARTSTYSGGMRRRLSVALSFIGNPKVVFLDEPTTGMDPISRRQVWDIIEAAKPGRAIILTTHSMEEADILGDRIGIMALARMRALGSSIALKRIFGSGYRLTVVLKRGASAGEIEEVVDFVGGKLNLAPEERSVHYLLYQVPLSSEAALADTLEALSAPDSTLAISDVQVGMSSLEEVFLAIARQAQMEVARETNETTEFTDPQTGTVFKVPLGAETVAHPDTGEVMHVVWGQDAEGRLALHDVKPAAK